MKIRLIAGGTAVAALVLVGLAVPTAAFAAETGTVVIQLVQPSGKALDVAGRAVDLYAAKGGGAVYASDGNTDATGKATFTDVPTGISLDAEANSDSGYLNNIKKGLKAASGKTITVKVTSVKGASISGTVTEGVTSTPLPGGDVVLLSSSGKVKGSAEISSLGSFTFAGVPSGSYRLQFNSRKLNPYSDAVLDFAWSYWDGAAASTVKWTSAKALKVKQQGSHSAPTAATGVNGQVFASNQISGTVTYWSPSSSHHGQLVEFVGSHGEDSFVTTLNSMGELDTTTINPGKYRVGILGDYDPIFGVQPVYWYVSDNEGPATSESKASWLNVDVAHKHIDFQPKPGNLF